MIRQYHPTDCESVLKVWAAASAVAQSLQGALEVEVFERNLMGRAFYARQGFVLMCKKLHAQTGLALLRWRLAADHPQQPMSR